MIILNTQDIDPIIRVANYIHPQNGTCWGPRIITDPELIYVVDGSLVYQCFEDSMQSRIHMGQVLFIPPESRHRLQVDSADTDCTISCIHFELTSTGAWGKEYQPEFCPPTCTNPSEPEMIHLLFRRCSDAFSGYRRYGQEIARTIGREIWLRLAEVWEQPGQPPLSKRAEAMVIWLRKHLTFSISRSDLANAFHITPEHCNYIFKRELGTSPVQFIQRERVLLAYRLIQEERLSVKEAANRVGYEDPFYFSRLFKKHIGVSPSRI